MTPKVSFFPRGKRGASPDQLCAIYAVIEIDGEKCGHFSTKIKVPAKYWMADGQSGIKQSSPENPISRSYFLADELNEGLRLLQKGIHQAADILDEYELPVTPETVKRELLSPRPKTVIKKFIEVVDELIDSIRPKRKPQTMLTYRTRRANIWEFLESKNLSRMYIHEFHYDHFEALQLWMIDYKNDDGTRRWGTNTINKHLTMVNRVLNYSINKGHIKSNPIGLLGLEYDETAPPQYLTPSERQRIYECDLTSLEKERDVSIFLYNTGLSYTDYMSLDDHHLFQVDTGEWFIKKERDKSNIFSIIPLLPQAHEIINKYGGVTKLPRPDISDLNKLLKVLGDVCRLPFALSTSTFRETFSSMMENEFMVKTRTLMYMMGHTNERQLRNYSSVMPARVLHELKKDDSVIPFNLKKYTELVKAS